MKELQDELKIKEGEIDSVKVIGTGLADSDQESPAGSRILADNIEQLNNSWAKIDHEVRQRTFSFLCLHFCLTCCKIVIVVTTL